MISANLATPGLLKKAIFWNEGCYVIISGNYATSKILSRYSNYTLNWVIWAKFDSNSCVLRKKLYIFNFIRILQEIFFFFENWSCLKACLRYFYQIFIFSPNDSPPKTMKNAFYFTGKALFVLKIFKFFKFGPSLFFYLSVIALEDDRR